MGMFAYAIIVLPQKQFSAFSGGIALAIIMTPIILRTTEEMLKLVPRNLREGSLALGASEWKTTVQVMLPAAINGVVTGIMLGVARVAGEAAPMIFTAFGNPNLSTDVNQPIATLPHMIYVYAISPYKDWHDKAWTTALVLMVFVLGLNVLARLFTAWQLKKMGWH
jgi:phosphate transport system permease protein